jgi:phosphoribosylanthranilate isomerase
MSVKVKICGITSLADALAACEAGADALGFNFYPASPRFIPLDQAAAIIRELPPFVSIVGLFVDPTVQGVQHAALKCRLDQLQFHGQVDESLLDLFPRDKVILACPVKDARSLKALQNRRAGAYLLDADKPGLHGGTGQTFRWDLGLKAKSLGRPIILAGGLNPSNVAEAIRQARPWAVDTASGVELSPGKKSPELMREFVLAAKAEV